MLSLVSKLYGKVADLRNALYERDIFDRYSLGAFTVSIGNITTGGTGKTPLVVYVAELLAARGEKVCILTRGYGRKDVSKRILVTENSDPTIAGDEPVELARRLKDKAIVIADRDRYSAGEWAKRKFGITAFILDDGFQHRRVRRDLDIACIDATNPFGGGQMLPAGRLREPIANLARAHAIVITRADLIDDLSALKDEIAGLAPNTHVFECRTHIRAIISIQDGERIDPRQTPSYAFCGLGNPDSFFALLTKENRRVAGFKPFPDHHAYTQADIDAIEMDARDASAECLLTTAKDAVKLTGLELTLPCSVVQIDVELDDPSGFTKLF